MYFFIRGERIVDSALILAVTIAFLINTAIGMAALIITAVVFYLIEAKKFNYSFIQLTAKAIVYVIIALSFRFLLSGIRMK
jgi:hypothetical protein